MKKILFMFALILSVMSMSAQTAIETPKILDNVYVGAQVGATTPMNFNSVFPLNSQFSVRVGKNWSPIFGTYLEGTAFAGNREMYYSDTFVKNTTVSLGSTVNLCNLIGGYELRKWDVNTVASLGWFHVLNSQNKPGYHSDDLVAKTGIDVNYNISDKWTLYLEPAVYWNLTQNEGGTVQFNKNYAQVGLSIGANYKFKTSNGTHNFKTYDIKAMNDELNALRSHTCPPQKTVEIVKTITEYKPIVKNCSVTFAKNSAELNERAKQDLNVIPEGSTVDIEASASPEGSVDYNLKLSQDRANAVKAYLESRGVKVDNADGIGVYDDASGRQATITIK